MGCTSSGKESVLLKNRKATLKKKASELSTLCGAEVCMVFLDGNGYLETWPEDVDKANATIINYNHIIQSQPPAKKPKTTTTSNKPPAAADLNLNLNLKEKKKQIILDQSRAAAGELSHTTTTSTDDNKNSNSHGINSMWDGNLENLSNESLVGLSNCLEAKIQTLGHKIDQFHNMKDKESKVADIQQLYNDQISCVGPIIDGGVDDEFEIIPSCCFGMNNPDMVMVDQFDQLLQPSLPLATNTMEFSSDRDRATMAASDSDSLSNYNNIIDDATWADYFTDVDIGNTISIDDDDGSDDQYWKNLLEAVEIDSNLAFDL